MEELWKRLEEEWERKLGEPTTRMKWRMGAEKKWEMSTEAEKPGCKN